jgi:hypothetical protein
MTKVEIAVSELRLEAVLEHEVAPKTCEAFTKLLPLTSQLIHVRWSGEAIWIPMDEAGVKLDFENHTSHPVPGQVIFYAGGYNEAEIFIPYGGCVFSSKVGQLAGNHFLTIIDGAETLKTIGERVLWEGAQPISMKLA